MPVSSWRAIIDGKGERISRSRGSLSNGPLSGSEPRVAGCDGVNVGDYKIGHGEFLELIAFNDAVCRQAPHGYASGGISSVQESDAPLSSGFHRAIGIGYSGVYVVAEVYPEISRGV